MKTWREIGESLKEKGISLEELLASGRDIRADLLKELYGIEAEQDDEDDD